MTTASNSFLIVISAADKATATIRKINDSVSKLTRPFDEVGKSFKSLGREIGIDKIGKNLQKMGGTARDAAKGIGRIVGPLAGITGIASVAGIVHLADSWANLGRSITYTAQNIGIGTTQLQEFQGAARLAGLSGDAMAQSLQGLGNTMEDALYGRNQQALMLFNRLTGGVKRNKDGSMDVTAEYDALGKAIYKLKTPQQQWLAASQFGLTALLPLIRKYHGDMKKARIEAEKQGIVMTPGQIASANQFADALTKIGLQGEVLKNTIGNALIPALLPLVKEMDQWIEKNRDLISTDIGNWVRDFAKSINSVNWKHVGDDIHTFIEDIGKVVHALGGVKGILIEIAAIKAFGFLFNIGKGIVWIVQATKEMKALRAASLAASAAEAAAAASGAGGAAAGAAGGAVEGGILARIGAWAATALGSGVAAGTAGVAALLYSKKLGGKQRADGTYGDELSKEQIAANHKAGQEQFKKREVQAMQFFMSKGWSRAQAAGIVGNLVQESTLQPTAANGNARGIAQWMGDRAKRFQQVEGVPVMSADFAKQLDFVNWELRNSESRAGNALAETIAPENAAMTFGTMDERFGNDGSLGKRINYARGAFAAVPGPYTAGGGKDSEHKVEVAVNVSGLPPGTTAKVNTTGATTGTARVASTTTGEAS